MTSRPMGPLARQLLSPQRGLISLRRRVPTACAVGYTPFAPAGLRTTDRSARCAGYRRSVAPIAADKPRRYTTAGSALLRLIVVCGACLMTVGCQGLRRPSCGPAGESIRAIWVTRWDYKTPADIARVMDNCKHAGFNTVLFQARGNGTALYRSKLEPWAEEFEGRDPGFDPLAVACGEAHKRGMSIHAWVNVMPGWRGKAPPDDRRQLYWSRPDWFWRDAAGRRQPLGWYNSLNPCYPEVRRYLVDVMEEIVTRYHVDGLHMDYIRFPNEWVEGYASGQVPDYPRDRRTLAMFRRATGRTPENAPQLWNEWRTAQVTQLVRDIRTMMLRKNRDACLSAAVGAVPEEAARKHYQDSQRWIAEGLLDAAFPMNYDKHMGTYMKRVADWSRVTTRIPVVMGVMFDKRDGALVVEQLERARRNRTHIAGFAYNSLFERLDAGGRPIVDEQSSMRTALRSRVVPYLRRLSTSRT